MTSQICSKEELENLYNQQYKDKIVPLSLHPTANYTIQTMLEHVPSRALAQDMCSKIVPIFEDLLAESITGYYSNISDLPFNDWFPKVDTKIIKVPLC